MVTFVCKMCNFKYTPRAARTEPPRECNNCGGLGTLLKEPTAADILNDSEFM